MMRISRLWLLYHFISKGKTITRKHHSKSTSDTTANMMKKEKREKQEGTSSEDLVEKHAKIDALYRKKCFLFALNAIVHNH